MNLWQLPKCAVIGGRTYPLHTDYRDILEIFSYFSDPDLPEYMQWQIALALFYEEPIPRQHQSEAMQYLSDFLCGGKPELASARVMALASGHTSLRSLCANTGIITLLNFSIPSLMPTITIRVVRRRNPVCAARGPHVEVTNPVNIVLSAP